MEKVTASHILVQSEATAVELMEQITTGDNFADLAKKYSKCPSGKIGGVLGQFSRGQMVKEFEDAVWALKPGSVTGPIRTQFGYHLIYRTA
jgi:peptidyl-prolyl cis-trans isomerase C